MRNIDAVRKAVLVAPIGMGGIQTWCLDYARELKTRSGVEGRVMFEAHGDTRPCLSECLSEQGVAVELFHCGTDHNRSHACRRLGERFVRMTDVVYPNTSGMAYRALAHLGPERPVAIAGCRGDFEHDYRTISQFAPWMDGIFSVSAMCAGRLEERLPEESPSVHVIPHGIYPVEAKPFPSGAIRLLFTGRLDPVKRLGDFLEVAAALSERNVDYEMNIVGDGPERARLENKASRFKIDHRVRFRGSVAPSEIGPWIDRSHVLLLLSERESFGRSALEAMSRGRPVIVTDTCGFREGIRDRENGFLVAPGEVARVVSAICEMNENRVMIERLGEAARKTVDETFHPDLIHSRHMDLLESSIRHRQAFAPRSIRAKLDFSRLDAPWLPEWATRVARSFKRVARTTRN